MAPRRGGIDAIGVEGSRVRGALQSRESSHVVIAVEEVAAAMKIVGTAARDNVDLPAGSNAAGRVEVHRRHLELLNHFLRNVQTGGPIAFPFVIDDSTV